MRFEFQSLGCGSLGDLCAKALVLRWQMSPILAQPALQSIVPVETLEKFCIAQRCV